VDLLRENDTITHVSTRIITYGVTPNYKLHMLAKLNQKLTERNCFFQFFSSFQDPKNGETSKLQLKKQIFYHEFHTQSWNLKM
jgi:hypothetical protein